MSKLRKPKTIKNMNVVWEKFIKLIEEDRKVLSKKEYEELLHFHAQTMLNYIIDPLCLNLILDASIERFNEVWKLIMKEAEKEEARKTISRLFNNFLDELHGQDYFGTEGQCDPRGDHRD